MGPGATQCTATLHLGVHSKVKHQHEFQGAIWLKPGRSKPGDWARRAS